MRSTQSSTKAKFRARSAKGVAGIDHGVFLARDLEQTRHGNASATWILCPWLEKFPANEGVWMSILASHDANATLLEALPATRKKWPHVYAGVFAVDTLRPTARLIHHVKSAGINGVINFPSASFIDGEAGDIMNGLSLGIEREIDFLEACSTEGLRIAGVTKSIEAARRLIGIGADFLVAHGGPPTRGDPDPSQAVRARLEGVARAKGVAVIAISRLLQQDRSRVIPSGAMTHG